MKPDQIALLRAMLRASAQPQVLLADRSVACYSPSAAEVFPALREGMSAEELLGEEVEALAGVTEGNSLMFSVESAGMTWDLTAADCMGSILLTAMKGEEQQRESALRAISDQLQQPVTALTALLPKLLPLLEDSGDPQKLRRAADINQSLYRLLRMIRHLSIYSTKNSAPIYQMQQLDLGQWLSEQAGILENLCAEAGMVLKFQPIHGSFPCRMDPAMTRIALLQLISNAIKYSHPGGEIELSLHRTDTQYRITVRDHGCGVSAGQMAELFHRMEHRGVVPDPAWGVGLGLPLARQLIRDQGGRLMLESVEGEGTSAHLMLPVLRSRDMSLRTPVQLPTFSGGFDPTLVELSDVLPSSVFDLRKTE